MYCVPDVYLTLNGDYIPNHGYVMISDIGSTDGTALICNTNNVTAHVPNGDWFAPDGTIVSDLGNGDIPGFERNRGPMMVRLHRNTTTDPPSGPSEGIYYCVVEDDTFKLPRVYVGLYHSGGGGILGVLLIAHAVKLLALGLKTSFAECVCDITYKTHAYCSSYMGHYKLLSLHHQITLSIHGLISL